VNSRLQDESGFTLVEMVVAITVASIVSLILASGFGVGARAYEQTTDQISGATSTGRLAAYLPQDVHTATNAVASTTGTGIACTGVTNARLELTGSNGYHVVYGVGRNGDDWVVERYDCPAGTAAGRTVVARNIGSADAVVATRLTSGGAFTGASLRVTGRGARPFMITVTGQSRVS
jgi:prepilin-type N-terminal cleavage/methylation domain-containing protein